MDYRILFFTFCGILLTFSSSASGRSPSSETRQQQQQQQQQTLAPDFTCPEEFGYFPHPDDCTQYYVCVFGGALLESCTGGLMYSHDLQTCDWPRNVHCGDTNGVNGTAVTQYAYDRTGGGLVETSIRDRSYVIPSSSSASSSRATDIIRTRQPAIIQQQQERVIVQQQQQQPQATLNDNSDLVNSGGIVSTSPRYSNIRFQDDNQADGSRLGRSYEQNVPNYKEEIYNAVGREHSIVKRQAFFGPNPGHDNMYPSSYWRQRDLDFGTYADQHVHRFVKSPYVGRPSFSQNRYTSNPALSSPRPQLIHHPHRLQPLPYRPPNSREPIQLPIAAHEQPQSGYDSEEHDEPSIEHYQQQPRRPPTIKTYHGNPNNDKQNHQQQQQHHHHRLVLPRPPVPTPPLLPPSSTTTQRYRLSPAKTTTMPQTTGQPNIELLDGFQPSSYWPRDEHNKDSSSSDERHHHSDENHSGGVDDSDEGHLTDSDPSNSPLTIDDISVNGNGKTTPSHSQQEIIIDPEYLNQRYAANVQPVANATANLYYDDSTYYIYDEEKEEPQYDDVDYKSSPVAPPQQPQRQQEQERTVIQQRPLPVVVETTTTTRRPLPPPTTTSTAKPSRGSSRGSARHKSSSSGNSRPTLKPSANILKDVQETIRDVYVDAPSRPAPVYETPVPNSPATKCRADECVLPDCFCGGKRIPGDLPAAQVPQIVLLTFDDSVNDLNKDLYRDLFEKGRKNPNGCPISATFYVSHEWTDYSQVQNLAADGHEIASHSVSHSFGEQFSQKKWDREIGGQREILAAYGGVKLSEIRGMRAPFLAIGGNNMFKMLHDSNFTYDSSMPVYENKPPSWPYTLDHKIFHDCMIPPCPTKSYPGVWEVPMVMWQDLKGGRCSMGDACSNPPTAEGVYNMLAKNFERHYTTNRAPFGLYYHAAWFTQPHHKEGFEAFLDTLVNMDDVFIITNWQALQWVRNPTPLSQVLNFEPWSCHNKNDRPRRCNHPKVCNLWHKSGVRYMKTCQQCPPQYPWVGNTGVPVSNSL